MLCIIAKMDQSYWEHFTNVGKPLGEQETFFGIRFPVFVCQERSLLRSCHGSDASAQTSPARCSDLRSPICSCLHRIMESVKLTTLKNLNFPWHQNLFQRSRQHHPVQQPRAHDISYRITSNCPEPAQNNPETSSLISSFRFIFLGNTSVLWIKSLSE